MSDFQFQPLFPGGCQTEREYHNWRVATKGSKRSAEWLKDNPPEIVTGHANQNGHANGHDPVALTTAQRGAQKIREIAAREAAKLDLSTPEGMRQYAQSQEALKQQIGPDDVASILPQKAAEPTQTLEIINPADLEGLPIPDREWIIQDWIPIGCTTANYGDGGTGKTLLAQQLQTACATGTPWCGLAVMRCRSLGYYCEDDPDELMRRQARINEHLGITFADLGDMRWISGVGKDNELVRFAPDSKMQVTKLFDDIAQAVAEFNPRLVPLDTAADLFSGNENDRHQVRQFLSMLYRLGGSKAVLLNAHPSRAGMSTGTMDGGSTGWSNTVRSRLSLTRPSGDDAQDGNERILTKHKANYSSIGDTIRLRWVGGVLVPVTRQGSITGSLSMRAVEEVFLALLDRSTEQQQRVSDSKNAGNYAPKVFARRPDREGLKVRDLEAAMHRLFAAKEIAMQTYGRDSRQQIVRTKGT